MRPTVVSVARVDPIKDQITLIKSADIVRKSIPDIQFIVYGSATYLNTLRNCREFVRN
jgi:glycosyltransferase involved in cell wall biosynthesis